MKVFIAGATGVLGRRVVPALTKEGHSVVGLARSEGNVALLNHHGAEARNGDLFNRKHIGDLSADCDAILHLATAIPTKTRATRSDWMLNDRIRTEGTDNLVAAAVRNRCRLYLQQSVALLYGNRNGEWVDEQTAIAERQSAMLRSAVEMERIVQKAAADSGLSAIILRCGSFYSHDSAQTVGMFDGIRHGKFPVIGSGRGFWNMVTVDDAAGAIVKTVGAAGGRGAIYNICDDEPVSYKDFVDFIAGELQTQKPRHVPVFLGKLAIGSDLVNVLLSSFRCRNQLAKKELGWQPAFPTYREGIRTELEKWNERNAK